MNRALAAAYAHGPGKEIKVGPAPLLGPLPGVRIPLPATDVARLLADVLTPSRWEPWNQYNDHRSYPSPRAAYLVDIEIVVGNNRWLFDPLRRATIAHPEQPATSHPGEIAAITRPGEPAIAHPSEPRTNGPLTPTPPAEPPVDHATPVDWSRDAPQGGRGNVYVGIAEEKQGRAGSGGPRFDRARPGGANPGRTESSTPQTDQTDTGSTNPGHTKSDGPRFGQADAGSANPGQAEFGDPQFDRAATGGVNAGQAEPVGPGLERGVRLEFVRRPDRLSVGYGEFADALTELEVGHVAGALVENAPRFGLRAYADADGVTLEPGDVRVPGKLPKRSSGLGPRGLAADPRPLPVEILTAFIRAMEQLPEGTLRHPGLVHKLAVHNVVGARDGWYTVDVRKVGPAMEQVQDCHGHPQAVIDVSGMNLALVIAADVPRAVENGPGEYQALLRAAGAWGQHMCTAAAQAGMFCRPLRSFDDPKLEAAAGFPLSHSLLYVLLAGRPKVTGPAYDLSPLEAS